MKKVIITFLIAMVFVSGCGYFDKGEKPNTYQLAVNSVNGNVYRLNTVTGDTFILKDNKWVILLNDNDPLGIRGVKTGPNTQDLLDKRNGKEVVHQDGEFKEIMGVKYKYNKSKNLWEKQKSIDEIFNDKK